MRQGGKIHKPLFVLRKTIKKSKEQKILFREHNVACSKLYCSYRLSFSKRESKPIVELLLNSNCFIFNSILVISVQISTVFAPVVKSSHVLSRSVIKPEIISFLETFYTKKTWTMTRFKPNLFHGVSIIGIKKEGKI